MHFVIRSLPKPPRRQTHHQSHRTIFNESAAAAVIKCVRDRGLNHAVEKERNLKPILNLKDLIKSEPSKSLPLSIISENRDNLRIPIRPIDFIRRFPSIFQEFYPGGIAIHPHIKLTPQVLDLDSEELLIYQSETCKQDVAERLLKLLMIGRVNKIPLHLLDLLKYDLGLPQDYIKSIVPEFPDYFRVKDSILELVCWSNELAVSKLEMKAMNGELGYEKGMPIAFLVQHSRGFEMDKKYKKWVDEWQKLPYISPYESALHLPPRSDESDKWAVGVLHEVLNLFVAKKAERENVFGLGEYLGIRSRFKRALLNHPGIFYLSSKIGMNTVVLRDAFKRDLLIENGPLMIMRSKYIHLMNSMREDRKQKGAQQQMASENFTQGKGENLKDVSQESRVEQLEDEETEEEEDEEMYDDESDHDDEDVGRKAIKSQRPTSKVKFGDGGHLRTEAKSSTRRNFNASMDKVPPRSSRWMEEPVSQNMRRRSSDRLDVPRTGGRSNRGRKTSA